MTNLADLLARKVEFDEATLKLKQSEALNNPYLADHIGHSDHPTRVAERQRAFREGCVIENRRLKPVLRLLIDVAMAVDRWQNAWASQDTSDAAPARKAMFMAMENVRKEVE